ncbi:MAG: PilZ domain-containing protein [Desulfobulbaceae bacterium]|nr:PilZ domain-containing protein [Desulfobulbaceae bacterium]
MFPAQAMEKRSLVRYRMKDALFAAIQVENSYSMANVVDLNSNGAGLHLAGKEKNLPEEVIMFDLLSQEKRIVLRSLLARVVYTRAANPHGNDGGDPPKRYGLQFVNLSALEKRMLDLVAKKYGIPE